MKKEIKKATAPVRISEVDFLISTFRNTQGLERLLYSIIEKYPAACIVIADSDSQLDRAYYKSLRTELIEAGMINRLVVHHIAYKSSLGHSFNELMQVSTAKYCLLLTDKDVITEDTDIEKMVRVLRSNKTLGIVGGSINKNSPELTEKKPNATEEGDLFTEVKLVSRFMLLKSDVRHSLRFDVSAADFATEFSTQVPRRVPYKMVFTEVDITSGDVNDIDDETKTSDSKSGGESTKHDLSTKTDGAESGAGDNNGGDDPSSSIRQDEKSENPAPSRRQGGGSTRSVQG